MTIKYSNWTEHPDETGELILKRNHAPLYDQLFELEDIYDYRMDDDLPDVVIVPYNRLTSDFSKSLTNPRLLDDINQAKLVIVSQLCQHVSNFPAAYVPQEWPFKNYLCLHLNYLPFHSNDMLEYHHYDFVFYVYCAYYQRRPWKTSHRQFVFTDNTKIFTQANFINSNKKTKIFVSANRASPHMIEKKLLYELLLRYADKGYLGFLHKNDIKLHAEGVANGRYLSGTFDDPTLNNTLKFNPINYSIDGDISTIYPIKDENALRTSNPIHPYYYENSFISFFSESCTADESCLLSEKTFNPLVNGHFVVGLAGPGWAASLINMGFRLPSFIDYSYSEINNFEKRTTAWLTEIERLMNFSLGEWNKLYDQNLDIIHHNKLLFWKTPYKSINLKQRLNML